MNTKNIILNNILVSMRQIIDATQLGILEHVLTRELQHVEVVECRCLPATVDNTNDYLINLFMVKKAPKLSEETVEQYMGSLKMFLDYVQKPLPQVNDMDIDAFLQYYKSRGNKKGHGK